MSKECLAPSDFGITPVSASVFGGWAEAIIGKAYLADVGRTSFYPFPLEAMDFADITIPKTPLRRGIGNIDLFLDFIELKNPGVSRIAMALLRTEANMLKIPDITTHDPAKSDFEWYEIKPASAAGKAAGLAKRLVLEAFFDGFGLPYTSGTLWDPHGRVSLGFGFVLGVDCEFTLEWFRDGRGLIFYHVCVNGDLQEVLKRVTIAAFMAAAAAVLFMLVAPLLVVA